MRALDRGAAFFTIDLNGHGIRAYLIQALRCPGDGTGVIINLHSGRTADERVSRRRAASGVDGRGVGGEINGIVCGQASEYRRAVRRAKLLASSGMFAISG